MKAGFSIHYLKGFNEHVDFISRLNVSFLDYLFRNRPQTGSDKILLEADANINIRLLTDKFFVVPYLSAGAGISMYKIYFSAYVPAGAGFQFNLGKGDAFIFTHIQYVIPVTDLANYHFNYSLSFAGALKAKKESALLLPL